MKELLHAGLLLFLVFAVSLIAHPRLSPEDCRAAEPESAGGTPLLRETGDHENIDLLGRWAAGPCRAAAVRDDMVYFGNGAYLEGVGFSDPAHPD
jgi:hypothetical protein